MLSRCVSEAWHSHFQRIRTSKQEISWFCSFQRPLLNLSGIAWLYIYQKFYLPHHLPYSSRIFSFSTPKGLQSVIFFICLFSALFRSLLVFLSYMVLIVSFSISTMFLIYCSKSCLFSPLSIYIALSLYLYFFFSITLHYFLLLLFSYLSSQESRTKLFNLSTIRFLWGCNLFLIFFQISNDLIPSIHLLLNIRCCQSLFSTHLFWVS